jgi:hypothetical protein
MQGNIIEIVLFIALGVAFAGGLAFLARWAKQDPIRICAYALIAVSFIYVGFALSSENPSGWSAIEMTGVAIFGSFAALSFVASPWFGVVGLALHPLWAIVFHYIGTGSAFTPAPFALADAGFTGALALYAGFLIWRGEQAMAKPVAQAKKGRTK